MSRYVTEYIDLLDLIVRLRRNSELRSSLIEDKVGKRIVVPVDTAIFGGHEQDSVKRVHNCLNRNLTDIIEVSYDGHVDLGNCTKDCMEYLQAFVTEGVIPKSNPQDILIQLIHYQPSKAPS